MYCINITIVYIYINSVQVAIIIYVIVEKPHKVNKKYIIPGIFLVAMHLVIYTCI